MLHCVPALTRSKQVTEEKALEYKTSISSRAIPENSDISDSSILKTNSKSPSFNTGKCSSNKIDIHSSSSYSSTTSNAQKSNCGKMMRLGKFQDEIFDVTMMNKRKMAQERVVCISACGISIIKPPNKKISRWCDVLLCYKIDDLTVAIKYINAERRYKLKCSSDAEQFCTSVRVRVNAHHEHNRKLLLNRMIEGFDEMEKHKVVPDLKIEESYDAKEDEIRAYIEQVLLSKNTKAFKRKESFSNFSLTELKRVKQLRKYLNAFKYEIFDECSPKLSTKMDIKDPIVLKSIFWVIDSVIENTCLPPHYDEIQKVLSQEHKTSDKLIEKIRILSKKPQEFFGINKKLKSTENWVNAVAELTKFPKKVLPLAMLQCLLDTTRYIHEEARRNHSKAITGDDLLPIVIFVLVKASRKNKSIIITEVDLHFINILINPEALQGEQGYYLCVYTAALEFIQNYDRKKIEERFNGIRRLREYGFF
jgi:hypothetical protein